MKPKKTTTLKKKVLLSMVFLVVLQIAAIAAILLLTGTSYKLDSNNVEILRNSVSYKCKNMESEMIHWSDFSGWIQKTDAINMELEETNGVPTASLMEDASFRRQLLQKLSGTVLENLRARETTGAFVILSNGPDASPNDAVYLRDLNPKDVSDTNQDILVEAGFGSGRNPTGFTLDIYWEEYLRLSADRDFFDKPMKAAVSFPELSASDLGYWSGAMRVRKSDIQVITYTVPLLDSAHNPYGVIGIELSLDYLKNYLNGSEISIAPDAGYYLGKSCESESGNVYETVYIDNIYHGRKLENGDTVTLTPTENGTDIWDLKSDNRKTGQVCNFSTLRLYNTNTPFYNEAWIVAGIVDKEQLHEASKRFLLAAALALALSMAIGILCSVFTTSVMFRPLRQMMSGLSTVSFTIPTLPRTGIVEIDDLAYEIERLRNNAFQAGSKAADIIEMSNISLGIYENNHNFPEVFCTRKFFELTELPLDGWNENYMPSPQFEALLQTFQQKCTVAPEDPSICYFTTATGNTRYLEIKSVIREEADLYVYMDVTSQVIEREKIKHERDYDVLTNLYNRRAFVRSVSGLINTHQISTGVLSMWDLDNLKYINDTYGHDMGDKYICMLADEFHKLEDTGSIAARISGDEFMVFLYDQDVELMTDRLFSLHAAFLKRRLRLPDGEEIPVSVSAGIAVYGQDSDTYESLVKLADFSMYEIKHREKGAIRRFERESFERDYILVQGIGELTRILEAESIHFVFQPIVDIKKKEIYAYEALMRPDSGILYNPQLLLRVAEKQSKLHQIEYLTWIHAVKSFAAQRPADCREKLFLNSISNQCLSPDEFEELESRFGGYLPHIIMEITENAQPDEDACQKKDAFCLAHGIGIAMDDYGSGYSTNSVLINGHFDFVKIDISMVKDIHLSSEKQTFVRNVIDYCHQCNTRVIIEGVETYEEYKMVESLGANYIQGYYLARPAAVLDDIQIHFDD